jgi:nucleotide-binding universal stress UspA family protein
MFNILVPLDGSDLAERALSRTLALASAVEARVTLLRVITPGEFRNEDTFRRVDWRLQKLQAHAYLEGVSQKFDSACVPFVLRVEEGRPAEVILETARELDIDLLIMSTHGLGAATDFPHGSIASKVLSAFTASVMLVGARVEPITEREPAFNRLLVPIDGSFQSDRALRVATSLATTLNAQLNVVYLAQSTSVPPIVSRNPRAVVLCEELAEMVRSAAERELVELGARLPAAFNLCTATIFTDDRVNPLAELARRYHPSLIIASANIASRTHGSARSLAHALSALDQVPILVLGSKGIDSAFCGSPDSDEPGSRTADVS